MTAWHGGGLYAITPGTSDHLLDDVEAVLAGGARLLQYRDKSTDAARRGEEARAMRQLCTRYRVPLIINDDVELALAVGADGVHLGARDVSVTEARRLLGAQAIIGVGCYNSIERARTLAAEGASYLGFGAFHPSLTKPQAGQADLAVLRQAAAFGLPVVAIGGITQDNGRALIEAGADYLAVVSSLFRAADIRAAAAGFASLFSFAPQDPA